MQVYAGLNQETGQIMAVKVQSAEKGADYEKQQQQLQVIRQVRAGRTVGGTHSVFQV